VAVRLLNAIALTPPVGDELAALRQRASKTLGLAPTDFLLRILRKSLDARSGRAVRFRYSVAVELADGASEARLAGQRDDLEILTPPRAPNPRKGARPLSDPPVVVGSGPAGLFAALLLSMKGYRPVVVEQGSRIDGRHRQIERFLGSRELDPSDNFLFGEGGAGTYSDGKLTARSKNPWRVWILDRFVKAGAPIETAWLARPHIGSDNLPAVVTNLREQITAMDGAFLFNHRVDQLELAGNAVSGLRLAGGGTLPAQVVVLAPGGSARPLFRALVAQGVALQAKPFQLGARIEHSQSFIDDWQFRGQRANLNLPAADYFVALKSSPARVHSFCMCPGGSILPAVEREGIIATNGMSPFARDGLHASSALVVTVEPDRLAGGPLAGVEFQLALEEAAWQAARNPFDVPCQLASNFLHRERSPSPIESSYAFGAVPVDLGKLMPSWIADSLRDALTIMEKRVAGFSTGRALLLWPESRASSPVRIVRSAETGQSVSTPGLFPAGEGAGYSGGIMSAAADGLQAASKLIESYAPPA